ncbi:MAG TPA: hypothetical protein ENG60_04200 [Thermoplasmatales archaeon]|nr:hypothetical protein [Thermoplasmatales archaeon]HEX17591.1 hypothetical protein [Thermoplasmatales archaeon]
MKKMLKICLVAGFIASVTLVSLYVAMSRTPRCTEIENELHIEGYYLMKESATNESLNITCMLYLTNRWRESGYIYIVAYVMNWDGLSEYRAEEKIGEIGANKTREIGLPLVLRRDSRKIDILIFEDGLLKMRGHIYLKISYEPYPLVNESKERWRCSISASEFSQV